MPRNKPEAQRVSACAPGEGLKVVQVCRPALFPSYGPSLVLSPAVPLQQRTIITFIMRYRTFCSLQQVLETKKRKLSESTSESLVIFHLTILVYNF